jgi:hypothetical protein
MAESLGPPRGTLMCLPVHSLSITAVSERFSNILRLVTSEKATFFPPTPTPRKQEILQNALLNS